MVLTKDKNNQMTILTKRPRNLDNNEGVREERQRVQESEKVHLW